MGREGGGGEGEGAGSPNLIQKLGGPKILT